MCGNGHTFAIEGVQGANDLYKTLGVGTSLKSDRNQIGVDVNTFDSTTGKEPAC